MNRKVTKVSTVTPMSTLTNSKSLGQGVKNIGKGKGPKPVSMGMKTARNAASEGAMEAASSMPQLAMKSERRPKDNSMTMGSYAGMPQLMRKVVKTGTKVPKAKAKMLPEVTVTAPKPQKRIALKVTSKRMR